MNDAYAIPRYEQPMDPEPPERTCSGCAYFKEVRKEQNGLSEYVGACALDVVRAGMADDPMAALVTAWLEDAEPDDEACDSFAEAM